MLHKVHWFWRRLGPTGNVINLPCSYGKETITTVLISGAQSANPLPCSERVKVASKYLLAYYPKRAGVLLFGWML